MQLITTEGFQATAIADLVAGSLAACHVALFKAVAGDLSVTTALADLTEADFTGYARSGAIVWNAPVFTGSKQSSVTSDVKQFIATDGVVPNVVLGYAIIKGAAPGTLHAAALFDTPRSIVAGGDGIDVVARMAIPLTSWGDGAVLE